MTPALPAVASQNYGSDQVTRGTEHMTEHVQPFLMSEKSSIVSSMQKLNETAEKILFVTDSDNRLIGSVSDGDIRRWILSGGGLDECVGKVCNKSPFTVGKNVNAATVRELMMENKLECIPVVSRDNEVVELLFWREIFQDNYQRPLKQLELPVTIMAGGMGTRLDPFTKILPKALIPIGDKPIIEIIIDRFRAYGISQYFISVNHKSKIIKSFFEELEPDYDVEYLEEKMPLGTAGGLKPLTGKVNGSVIVTNCDILINCDYSEIVDYHRESANDITLVASLKRYALPYGVCRLGNAGDLINIEEKPEYSYLVNTGLYVLKSEVFELIPENEFFHMTHLIEKAKAHGKRVGVFPISEGSWLDTGEWDEYRNAVDKVKL